MGLLIGLTPFVGFFLVMRSAGPLAGLCAALAISLALCWRMWRRGEAIKILEAGSLVLFFGLTSYTLVIHPVWSVATVRLSVDGGLLVIILLSLAIRHPFTLQYARENVPRELWGKASFRTTNYLITGAWAAAFMVLVAADAAAEYVTDIPLWIDVTASVAAFIAALSFTVWYPAMVQRRALSSRPNDAPGR